ncbi:MULTISPECIES: conjugal transfer protein [Vibrio harveyi group]|uniref:conjugal transfer protein n=1 Tax=Vibrio harveyi group TaxID=717610 RepID=UPI000A2FE318|nr:MULTISPECIES: conjugal transfer protein [Vibrio harveyi group]ARR10586.1 sex pilus assembly and synthesis protein [Vibrio campbellii]WCP78891.1 conjugal transfer protein [Vibrio parahaemolyticus]WHP52914.1 conjugal transfer protein [Vibrio parahaemolyticus]
MTLTTLSSYSPPAQASDADCAIWLCLPVGFIGGCGDAKKAFLKRIKKFKPPLPSFSKCMFKGDLPNGSAANMPDTEMTSKTGKAARLKDGSIIHGTPCTVISNHGGYATYPRNCVATLNYVQTYMNGQPYGEIYYY